MRRYLFLPALVIILSGCEGMNPQTRAEFIKMNRSGAPFAYIDTHTAKRPLESVVKSLRQKVDECFQVDVSTTRSQGGITTMNVTDEFRTRINVVNKNHAELTTQFHMKGMLVLQKVPEGGFYHTAMDIDRIDASSTKLTYYGSSFESSKLKWQALKQWSEGNMVACP